MIWPFTRKVARTEEKHVGAADHDGVADLVRAFPDPVMVLDRNGIVIIANKSVRGVLDVDPVGQHLSSSIRAPAVLDAVTAVLAGQAPVRIEYEIRVPLPRHFDVHVSLIAATKGEETILIVLKDLTREQQIERMRADFVANASHELRTPLTALSGFIETLLGAAKNDAAARQKFLESMQSQADRMKRLIDDLLSLSRIEMNVHLRPSSKVDLAEIARHVAELMSGMAKAENCELRVSLPNSLTVTGDRDELVQVVQNLVENALKYASTGKVIDIAGHHRDGQVELTVSDRGPGIAPEHMPRLTERFYRVSVQQSRSRGGTGLGLAIVKHILIRHRGRLRIESKLGKGSTFTIQLPDVD